jgi:uncharacterized phiE125 gp8 family phage protein
MSILTQRRLSAELITAATSEPLTLDQAKAQLNIATNNNDHDLELSDLIAQAREQWEGDTDTVCCTSTWRVRSEYMQDALKLPKRPIQSIESIKYYDGSNTLVTLTTDFYNFDAPKREIKRQFLKVFPVSLYRWDAWETIYVCGFSKDGSLVPAIAKRAMLLLVGYYFEQRGDADSQNDLKAYEKLVARFMRGDYP